MFWKKTSSSGSPPPPSRIDLRPWVTEDRMRYGTGVLKRKKEVPVKKYFPWLKALEHGFYMDFRAWILDGS